MAQTIANAPMLESISNLVNAIQTPATADSFLKSEVKSIIPAGVNTIASATDPYQRQSNSVLEGVISTIP